METWMKYTFVVLMSATRIEFEKYPYNGNNKYIML
jgi:hypothetical protein